MKIIYSLSLVALFVVTIALITGCAGMTGVTTWKETAYVSNLDRDATIKIAIQALAQTGKVSFSDPTTGTISGECAQQVDATIAVLDTNGKVTVTVKSKLNIKENSMVIETGERRKCIEGIADQMKLLGCALTVVSP